MVSYVPHKHFRKLKVELMESLENKNNTLSRRTGWLVAGAITLAVLATGGISYWSEHRYIEFTDNAYVKADSSMVAPKVSGYISALLAQDNRPVKAGELLAQIDARDYTMALEHARAEVALRSAALTDALARKSAQQAVIAQSAARVEAAGASVKLASSNLARQKKMSTIGFSSIQQTEESDTDLTVKHAELERETAGLKNAREQVAVLDAGVGVAQAQLDQAQATLHRAALELSYTRIVAPIDGVVAARTVRVGQYVQPGTQLMAVVPMNAVYVVANFKETQLERVRKIGR